MSPSDASKLARQLMNAHGLNDWRFRFNRRKRAMGLCRYDRKIIELSIHFVLANAQSKVQDTILHEIAHALAGSESGHGPKWQQICKKIGAAPNRLGEAQMPSGKWRAVCPACGFKYTRHRRPAAGSQYSCSDCGPKRGKLIFKPNIR